MRYSEFKFQALLIATALLWVSGAAMVPYFTSQLTSLGASALGFNVFTLTGAAYLILTMIVTVLFVLEFRVRRAIGGFNRAVMRALSVAKGSTSMESLNGEILTLRDTTQKGVYLVVLSDPDGRAAKFLLGPRHFDGKAASLRVSHAFVMRLIRSVNAATGDLGATKVAHRYQVAVADARARIEDDASDDTMESFSTPGLGAKQFQ